MRPGMFVLAFSLAISVHAQTKDGHPWDKYAAPLSPSIPCATGHPEDAKAQPIDPDACKVEMERIAHDHYKQTPATLDDILNQSEAIESLQKQVAELQSAIKTLGSYVNALHDYVEKQDKLLGILATLPTPSEGPTPVLLTTPPTVSPAIHCFSWKLGENTTTDCY
jgi:hypothetical protein